MALYIPHSIFHLARFFYVRPETSGPYYVVNATSWPLYPPGKRPGNHFIESWWVSTAAENLAPHRDLITGPSSPKRVAIPTELSRPNKGWSNLEIIIVFVAFHASVFRVHLNVLLHKDITDVVRSMWWMWELKHPAAFYSVVKRFKVQWLLYVPLSLTEKVQILPT